MKTQSEFRFEKNDTVGAPAAEDDYDFLSQCFVDTGDLAVIEDTSDRRVIILGRTGSGKSALVARLAQLHPDRVIIVKPDDLALSYISNSTILNYITSLGINLDPFYKLLWRHVFTVEVLRRIFDQTSCQAPGSLSLMDKLRARFPGSSREDKEMQLTLDYLEEWGSQFWSETEYRVVEITQKIESQLDGGVEAAIGTGPAKVGAKASSSESLSEEQKTEVVNRAQAVVNSVQVENLRQVFKLIGGVLDDKQKSFYIVIDSLDENWVEDRLKYKLIRGLILAAREFNAVRNLKTLLVLRRDLIDRVFQLSRDGGFQEEKYQGLYLPLSWNQAGILEVLDRRVSRLVSRRYTKTPVTYSDLLPSKVGGTPIGDYIFKIADKPRDVIALFNICIQVGVDKLHLSEHDFNRSVHDYSRSRLNALADEWNADYPCLLEFAEVLRRRPASFKASQITSAELEELCLDAAIAHPLGDGILCELADSVVAGVTSVDTLRTVLLQVFYRVGLVGLKTSADSPASWNDDKSHSVLPQQINLTTSIVVSPKYAPALQVLGWSPKRKRSGSAT